MTNDERYTTTEKSLSDKERDVTISGYKGTKYHKGILTEDVKEFIQKCEKLSVYAVHNSEGRGWGAKAIRIDDLKKLAGDKLT